MTKTKKEKLADRIIYSVCAIGIVYGIIGVFFILIGAVL